MADTQRGFREEVARLVIEAGFSTIETGRRLLCPKAPRKPRAAKAEKLGGIGKGRQPLTEVELVRVKQELATGKLGRDIPKKQP